MENVLPVSNPDQQKASPPTGPHPDNSQSPPDRSGGSPSQRNSPRSPRYWIQLLLFVLLINLLFYGPLIFSSIGGQQTTINLSYTSFLQQVQQGNVKDVTLNGNAVSGDFKTPFHQPQNGSGNGTATYSRFTSYVPETGDPSLLPLLEKNGVQVTAQPVQTPWWLTVLTLLLNALPILILLYFGYMVLRSMRQAQQGGGIFGVGRSRAKLYNEERPSTTFADVAGVCDAQTIRGWAEAVLKAAHS